MITSDQVSVVLQGDIRYDTLEAIASVRHHLPNATLILSTFPDHRVEQVASLVDRLVVSEDPGPLPPATGCASGPENNINRQIRSAQAGLALVCTPYALKLRSDAIIKSRGFLRLFSAFEASEPGSERLVVNSYFTRHPRGISCYLFHVSDWMVFGPTKKVVDYWNVPLMTREDATWFDQYKHIPDSTLVAKRFRARYAPEQYVTVAYAAKRGYRVPQFLNDSSNKLIESYERFLAKELIVEGPKCLGIELKKYDHVAESLYLRIDCLSHRDWRVLYENFMAGPAPEVSDTGCKGIESDIRNLANRFRHVLSFLALARKRLGVAKAARGEAPNKSGDFAVFQTN